MMIADLTLLKEFEGCKLKAYKCSAGVNTIGYGFTKGVQPGDVMTQAQCNARLKSEIRQYEDAVMTATGGVVNEHEFSALVSLAWNIGIAGMKKSTVVKAHNRGDKQAAARAFGMWNKVAGKPVAGLTRRRAAEAALYLTPSPYAQADDPMPQAVDEPKPMTSSTTVIAGGTAALATATQVADSISNVKYSLSSLGDWVVPVLGIVALAAVAYIIFERYQNRARGAI
jgi:lysozyme